MATLPQGCLTPHPMAKSIAFSYLILLAALILAGWLHLSTLLVTVLFSSFALHKLHFLRKKWIAVGLFLILVVVIFCGFAFFFRQAFEALPKIVSKTIPDFVRFADSHGISLPFTDVQSLKDVALDTVREMLGYLGNFAKIATKEFVMLVVGIVISIGIFLHREPEETVAGVDLYTYSYSMVVSRFTAFYRSFETVMGAQLVISLVNTIATSAFVLASSLPYAGVVIPMTFICGLLPIIGNIISNALIVGIALGISSKMAGWALVFLVVIHKLEYLLNSKIVGSRIRHPMWLTLIALILGECLMGLSGIILAPVILNFLKVEGSRFAVGERPAYELV